ncbi:MAG: ATP-binding protein [Bacteroidota bacterium]|nr:ATP-binding protein [Bacteroidota bacterium]
MSLIRKCIFVLISLLEFYQFASAQAIDTRISDEEKYPIITGKVKLLKTDSSFTIDSIILLKSGLHFSKLPDKPIVFTNYDTYYYWFTFTLVNHDPLSKDLFLLMGPTGMRDGELYQKANGKWTSVGKTGHASGFMKKSYQYMHDVFPLTMPALSTDTFYIRMNDSHDYHSFGFSLLNPRVFKAFENKVYFFLGVIVGVLALFLIFNLYLYYSVKEKVHLWYALYIGTLILIVFKNDQMDEQFLGLDSETAFRLTSILAIGAFAIVLLMHVIQLYLHNIPKKSFLYKITLFVKWNLLLSAVAQLAVFYFKSNVVTETIIFAWADNSAVIGVVFIIINCVYSVYNGFKPALFILGGFSCFLIGAIQRLLLIPTFSIMFPPSIFHIGMVLETTIISFGFIYSYRKDREEKKKLQLNFQQELHKAQVEIQEHTFKNVSEEIYNNIGQILSLAKLNIGTINLNDPKSLPEKIENTRELVGKAIHDLRDLSGSLNADIVSELGLIKSIKSELAVIKKNGDFKTVFIQKGEIYPLPYQKELILFRIFQEVSNNIIKHSKANTVEVVVHYFIDKFILQISDDGEGFDLTEAEKIELKKATSGIKHIRQRSGIIGAHAQINSEQGKGTTVIITLPLS